MSQPLWEQLEKAVNNHQEVALITITNHPEKTLIGTTFLLQKNADLYDENNLSQGLRSRLIDACLPLLNQHKTKTVRFSYNDLEMECYVEVFPTPAHLIVAGAGHVSEPVAEIGKMLDFYVTVIDDRKEFANHSRFPYVDHVVCSSYIDFFKNVRITPQTYILLLTRGHKFDVVSLQELLKREEMMRIEERTTYIGMIGSRRRISGVFEQLKSEFTDHNFVNIYSPVGLDIGAQTPAEIAVSIMAEVLKVKNASSGNSLKEKISSYSKLTFRERNRK
ncbi:XdhC family protein [Virgibacillus byunsanensis]|uniref:XdhC family protein n=1 Tax=Virgibacillus byunsanensis TaxID=570945 RepID=A0ABW3LPF2_9BACI